MSFWRNGGTTLLPPSCGQARNCSLLWVFPPSLPPLPLFLFAKHSCASIPKVGVGWLNSPHRFTSVVFESQLYYMIEPKPFLLGSFFPLSKDTSQNPWLWKSLWGAWIPEQGWWYTRVWGHGVKPEEDPGFVGPEIHTILGSLFK